MEIWLKMLEQEREGVDVDHIRLDVVGSKKRARICKILHGIMGNVVIIVDNVLNTSAIF